MIILADRNVACMRVAECLLKNWWLVSHFVDLIWYHQGPVLDLFALSEKV